MFKCRKKIKKTQGACSSPISMVLMRNQGTEPSLSISVPWFGVNYQNGDSLKCWLPEHFIFLFLTNEPNKLECLSGQVFPYQFYPTLQLILHELRRKLCVVIEAPGACNIKSHVQMQPNQFSGCDYKNIMLVNEASRVVSE